MKKRIIQRQHIFVAAEGASEQSFIRWLQELSDKQGLSVHLDCQPLSGGGYQAMLKLAIRLCEKKALKAKSRILLVDSDRYERGDDDWSRAQLEQEASKENITVCFQLPNLEGILLRLLPNNERVKLNSRKTYSQLQQAWPSYAKPADARTLASKFTYDDLLRVAKVDSELKKLLLIIGLISG